MNEQNLSIPKIFVLGLAPGLVMLLLAFVFSSSIIGINLSVYLSVIMSIIFGLIPSELGILKYIAWKENKKKILFYIKIKHQLRK